MLAIMHGYVPPNMDPQQARMLYSALPHLPKSPRTGPITAEMADRLAGGPSDPSPFNQEDIRAANQQMVEGHMRQRFGPIYVPSLHRDHNRVVSQKDNQMSLIEPEYSYDGGARGPQSIREMTDQSGNVVSQYGYDPYGKQTKIGGTGPDADFGYAGMYVHQRSGLNLTPHRAYNPVLGRWMSRDPIQDPTFRMMPQSPEPVDPTAGVPIPPLSTATITPLLRDRTLLGRFILTVPGVASRTRNLNPYTYVYNNPVNLSDPSGLDPYDDFGLCVAILAGRLAACNNNPACMQEAWNWFWNECIKSIGCTSAPMGPGH